MRGRRTIVAWWSNPGALRARTHAVLSDLTPVPGGIRSWNGSQYAVRFERKIPFTGVSGELIEKSIELAGRMKEDVFISNAVNCHPRRNRQSHEHEIVNCSPFLHRELDIVRPRLVITLGRDAERALIFFYPRARVSTLPFETPRGRRPKGVPYILTAKHPSWIQRQHDNRLEAEYVSGLAAAIRWSFGHASEEAKG